MHAIGFSTGWVRDCVRIRALYGDEQRRCLLTTVVLPVAIKYTVVAKWRYPADRVAAQGGLTIQAHWDYRDEYLECS